MKKGNRWSRNTLLCSCFLVWLCFGCGCQSTQKEKKLRNLDYTVVAQEEIPEDLKVQIEEKKQTDFNLTKQTDDGMYLVRGYGRQEGSGYSIQMLECYLTEDAVYVKTELKGGGNTDNNKEKESFPYIVVKTERQDKIVVFK